MLPDVLDMYLRFVEERHRVWERRQTGEVYSDDPIIANHKFTNVFRVLDFGSQYVLTDLLADEPDELTGLMRCFLYRHTGRPEAWDAFAVEGLPSVGEWDRIKDTFKAYRGATTTRLSAKKPYAERANKAGGFQSKVGERSVFTSAYLVFPQSQVRGTDKIDSIVDLTARLFDASSPDYVWPDWVWAKSQADRFAVLRRNKGVGDFMSMQTLTDWGYWQGPDLENAFVAAGPGAIRGASAVAPGTRPTELIEALRGLLQCGEYVPLLAGRPPSSMDVQNTLCEFSKYVRFMERGHVGKPYVPAHPGPQPQPVLPEHWLI